MTETLIVDEDGNGIDDRIERTVGPVLRLLETGRRFFAKAPPVSTPLQPSLARVAAELLAVKYKKIAYPAPIAKAPTGYEYRAVDARSLARLMKTDPDQLALAAATASEASRSTIATLRDVVEELAIAEAIINDAEAIGRSVVDRVTNETILVRRAKGTKPIPVQAAGHFGRQGGRWCASLLQPTAHHLEVGAAAQRMAATGHRFTNTARRWTHLRTMDWLRRKHGTGQDAEANVRVRYAEGWRVVAPILDAAGATLLHPWDDVCLYSQTGTLSLSEALQVVADGRRRFPG